MSWNRSLEERVAKQVAAIERIDRLRRFLPPQVAQVIASSDAPASRLASHRREVTVFFCNLRGFNAFVSAQRREMVRFVLVGAVAAEAISLHDCVRTDATEGREIDSSALMLQMAHFAPRFPTMSFLKMEASDKVTKV